LVLTGSFHLSVTKRDDTIRASTSLGADGSDDVDPSLLPSGVIEPSGWLDSDVWSGGGGTAAAASRVPESAVGDVAVVKSMPGLADVPLS
jgi:hypothetical protein